MNILILQGSPRANGNTAWMAEEYRKAAEAAGHKVTFVDVAHKKIAGCMACEYCHGKGNGAIAASSTTGASRIAIAFRELEIDVDDSEARVDGWIDYSGTDAAWPRYEPKAEKFLANLEKADGKWLISRIKVFASSAWRNNS